MIDLHCHILPGIDDGARNLNMSLEMARMASADGTRIVACTPHFMPGIYDTTVEQLNQSIKELKDALEAADIPISLVAGGDIHAAPDLPEKLEGGLVPVLGNSRYFLFEPPHQVLPPNLAELCKNLLKAGYVPVLTHPERLAWIENHYDVVCELDQMGVAIQLTARSITGGFGKRPKYWSEVMLEEGRVDLIASDAHNVASRPPGLTEAMEAIGRMIGDERAQTIVLKNPVSVLRNRDLAEKPERTPVNGDKKKRGFWDIFEKMTDNMR